MNLLLGDCRLHLGAVPDGSVDLVVMDPPYLGRARGSGCFGTRNRAYRDEVAPLLDGVGTDVMDLIVGKMKAVNIYVFCNKSQLRQHIDYFDDLGCNVDLLTWHKSNPVPACGNKYLSDTEYIVFARDPGVRLHGTYETLGKYYLSPVNKTDKRAYGHPTVKPLGLVDRFVVNSSKEGDLVLDPFMGTGTTGVSCVTRGRRFVGIESDPGYYETAVARISSAGGPVASGGFA